MCSISGMDRVLDVAGWWLVAGSGCGADYGGMAVPPPELSQYVPALILIVYLSKNQCRSG